MKAKIRDFVVMMNLWLSSLIGIYEGLTDLLWHHRRNLLWSKICRTLYRGLKFVEVAQTHEFPFQNILWSKVERNVVVT